MDRLNILVLHSLGDPLLAQAFLPHHVFALQRNFPEHGYLYHDTALPLPEYVRDTDFDAIVLDVTFLTARWAGQQFFQDIRAAYSFVRESPAAKIAFPQDEYDCHLLLDEWMCDWQTDVVFSVISSRWDVLYPRYHRLGEIRLGYTGYIDETLIDRKCKAFADRSIDIGYRARKLPPYFGRVGEAKWTIGRDVATAASRFGLKTDIVLGHAGTLLGNRWLDFLNDSKFTLGANSGSSLLDPRGEIQRAVKSFLLQNPQATFEEVEAAVFPGLDGVAMTAISPRVLEAAMLESGQILVDGEYSGIVQPWEHYIPIRSDAANFDEVYDAMRDQAAVFRMISRCREAVLSTRTLRYSHKARTILELIGELKSRKGVVSSHDSVDKVGKRYEEQMTERYRALWTRQRLRGALVDRLAHIPWLLSAMRAAKRRIARTSRV